MGTIDWKKQAIDDLKSYRMRKAALHNLSEHIEVLESELQAFPVPGPDTVSVTGTKPPPENHWLNIIDKKTKLETAYKNTKRLVEIVERGLSTVSLRQRYLLEGAYIASKKEPWYSVAEKLSISSATYYRELEKAETVFAFVLYGNVDNDV